MTHHRIGIIGTGRVAQALALALRPHSAPPPMIWGRSASSVQVALERTGDGEAVGDLARLVEASDIILIAVTDDALGSIIADLGDAGLHPCSAGGPCQRGSGVAPLAPLATRALSPPRSIRP
jgi:pyrroline-5-carboxylate reductase